MSKAVVDLTRALDFAALKHRDQRRKGAAAEPYLNHLTEVARLVAEATEGKDTALVIAALLHDTIEDTRTTRDELEHEFSPEVAALVSEVTDDKNLPKAERKRLQIVNAPHKSERAKMIKIADKISNLRSIVASPPVHWDAHRQREYFEWAAKVVDGLRGVNRSLEADFDAAHRAGLQAIEKRQ